MKVVGMDYSSRGYNGLVLVNSGEIKSASVFKSKAREDESDPAMLVEYERWLSFKLGVWKPDIVIVEELAVFQNKKTIRALAHREAVALMTAKKKCKIVIHRPIVSARAVVCGPGGGKISKDELWDKRHKFFDFDFGHKSVGGTDKMDAATLALAAPVLLERG